MKTNAMRGAGILPALMAACALLAAAGVQAQDREREPAPAGLQSALAHGLRPNLLKIGEPLPQWSLQARMAHHRVPGVAIAVLKDGQVVQAMGFGVRQAGTQEAIDADTLFSVGSISKIATAATSLRLVADGRLDLDRDVNGYLRAWQVAPLPGVANAPVTLRMLMSHTAGLTVHGFKDFLPGEPLPALPEILDGTPPAKNDPIRLQHAPGLKVDYSGGGTMVQQRVIEDVAGQPLEAVARAQVFDPLGMHRSTFLSPLPAERGNIARAHDRDGAPIALPRGWQAFPEQAASGLWTSANELGAFVGALIRSYRGADGLLPQSLARQMMTEVAPSPHGLGPQLEGAGATRIFHHGGANDSYHAWIEGYLETGDGFVILTNGANGYALHREIRNALSDAIGLGVNPLVRTVDLDLDAPIYADYVGVYRLDPAAPMDHRSGLADSFDADTVEVTIADGAMRIRLPDEDEPRTLQPLSPTRFAATTTQYEFHRDAHGQVRALSVEQGSSRAYYRRDSP
ncbi:serine hydrolase domain-containing protein [Luteimonas suaedae]|uniref:serine hydrolase domain-containing protein n=1 Tax=Luteimonas suaedae TaxID=2605430 RepID=UPI001CA87916|nr:serine hydrolase domain-containing protein [Luteimonas suaedae]